jgi:hypothetical protein
VTSLDVTHRPSRRRRLRSLHREASPTGPSGGVFASGLPSESKSSTLLVRDDPGQPGAALSQRRAPGRGATAPAVDRRRCRGRSPSRDSESPDMGRTLIKRVICHGSDISVSHVIGPITEISNEVMQPEQRKRKPILGQFTRTSVCLHQRC